MFVKKSLRLAPLVLALVAVGVQAQGGGDSIFSVSGFGTLGYVATSRDDAQFVIPGQTQGADKSGSGEVDSKLGVQLGAKFNTQFSATVQVLTKQNGEGNWKPEVEWAFGKWQATPGLALRVGRMGAPFFAVSDFRDVGYANLWLRPPIDVYGQVPVSHFDGADVNWSSTIAGKSVTVQALVGQSESRVRHVKIKLKDMAGVTLTTELADGLNLRLGHVVGKLSAEQPSIAALTSALRQTPYASVGNQLIADGKDASFTSVGLNYDVGQWVAAAEYTLRRTDAFVPDTTGWYATLGHRVGQFTPYATVSRQKTDSSNVDNTVPATLVVGGLPLRALVDAVAASQSTPQKSLGLGVRWDAWRNVAVKAQFDSIKTTGAGQFYSPAAGFNNERVSVYSLAVDVVF